MGIGEQFHRQTVAIGAFLDDQVNALIGLDGIKEAAIYLQAFGAKQGA